MIGLTKYDKEAIKQAAVKLCSELIEQCLNTPRAHHCTYIQNNLDVYQFDYLKNACEKFGVYVKMTTDGMVKLSVYKFVAKKTYQELFRNATELSGFPSAPSHDKPYVITTEPFMNKLNALMK